MFLVSLASVNVNNANAQESITTDAVVDQETQVILDKSITEDPELEDIGTTPDQAGYGLKTALERIRLALTLNRAKKAELALQLAELKVKEARLMAAKNNLEALERIKIEHRKYVELAERNIETADGTSNIDNSLSAQARIKARLEAQNSQVDDLESLIFIRMKGLTEEQRAKLLALIEEFKKTNEDVEVKIDVKDETVKTRLKARGLSEVEIEDKYKKELEDAKLTKEEILERKAYHQVDQAEKMYNLAARLIEKGMRVGPGTGTIGNQTFNVTVQQRTLDLHAKAKVILDEAKVKLEAKEFFKAIELAHDSKKLSALTIASIHGGLNERALEERIEKIEEKEIKEVVKFERRLTEEQIRELREKQKRLEEEIRLLVKEQKPSVCYERLKEQIMKLESSASMMTQEEYNRMHAEIKNAFIMCGRVGQRVDYIVSSNTNDRSGSNSGSG